jgi:hypothetical protein
MATGMGTDEARIPATNRPRHSPQRVVEKVGRSITNSETPHTRQGSPLIPYRSSGEYLPASGMTLSAEGPWELPVNGHEVLQVTFAFPIDVIAYGDGGASTSIRFEGAFDYGEPDGEIQHLNAANQPWEHLAVLLALRRDRLKNATASVDGQLQITLATGRTLTAGPDHNYENWAIWGAGYHLIALPGGGEPAVWLSDSPKPRPFFRGK